MISTAIFARYARALADVTLAGGDERVVGKDLETYREIFRQVPGVLEFFDNPAVQRETKEKVLSALMERYQVGQTTRNFMKTLLAHHRIRYFNEICDFYIKTVNERKGIVAATVTTAGDLGEPELAALLRSLSRATGSQVTLSVQTDSALLGGVIVQIGSTVYDGSIRTQLDEMRRRLME